MPRGPLHLKWADSHEWIHTKRFTPSVVCARLRPTAPLALQLSTVAMCRDMSADPPIPDEFDEARVLLFLRPNRWVSIDVGSYKLFAFNWVVTLIASSVLWLVVSASREARARASRAPCERPDAPGRRPTHRRARRSSLSRLPGPAEHDV
eukprot:1330827-Prymnesium_polylepis.1